MRGGSLTEELEALVEMETEVGGYAAKTIAWLPIVRIRQLYP